MRRDKNETIVVVNRKKATYAKAHGGAWKVAYADFVTAMMAFFLLLWLLNAVSQVQVAGLANFFAETDLTENNDGVVSLDPGQNEMQGESTSLEKLQFDVTNPTVLELLDAPKDSELGSSKSDSQKTLQREDRNPDVVRETYEETSRNFDQGVPTIVQISDSNSRQKNTLLVKTREDGLMVNIASKEGVFKPNSADLTLIGERQLAQVVNLLLADYQDVNMSIIGHTSKQENVNSWGLSLERGMSVMLWMLRNGFREEAILSVDGYAFKQLLDFDQPQSPINDRVVLLFTNIDVSNGLRN